MRQPGWRRTTCATRREVKSLLKLCALSGLAVALVLPLALSISAQTPLPALIGTLSGNATSSGSSSSGGSSSSSSSSSSSGGSSGGTSSGFLAGAYNQYSYQGLTIVNGAISANDGTRQIQGTDTVTGFVYPNTKSVWNASVAPSLPDEMQIIADNASTDFTASILTGATLPACGTPVNYLEATRQVPFDGNIGGISGKSEQQVGIHWAATGNIGDMWYYRFWARIGPNFSMAPNSNGGAFYTIEESKTGTSSYRCSLGLTTGAAHGSFTATS